MSISQTSFFDVRLSGVYCITNSANGKRYIGSTARSFKARWSQHITAFNHGKHHAKRMQADWVKYGKEVFEFSVICTCEPAYCLDMEQYFLDRFESYVPGNGYNKNPCARNSSGYKPSAETKRKIGASRLGRAVPQAHKDAMKIGWKLRAEAGVKRTKENRKNNSEAMKKRWADPIQREAIKKAISGGFAKN